MSQAPSADQEQVKGYGSFRDSLRAPIHRWFTYPAGYSHRLVESKISQFELSEGDWIVDPFMGTGTTCLAAKGSGVNSLGVEAHPFVYWVAQTKLYDEYDRNELEKDVDSALTEGRTFYRAGVDCDDEWPSLVYKCFPEDVLKQLYALREAILVLETDKRRRDFLKIALTATLRVVTSAGAGWPYIAPSKFAERTVVRDAFDEFEKRCNLMLQDVSSCEDWTRKPTEHKLIKGDARRLTDYADSESVDMVLTSPPYLNNYDYADRTRLETYFWGMYDSWGEITREVRDHLIMAATTQVRRTAMTEVRECPGIKAVSAEIHQELIGIIERLSELRKVKGGKKGYDMMVAGYFEDMLHVIRGAFEILKPGRSFVLVLGDSAPYGVHVRTDELVGELAVAVGFESFEVEVIRTRGDKWAGNSQRHKVPLRESIVTINKGEENNG